MIDFTSRFSGSSLGELAFGMLERSAEKVEYVRLTNAGQLNIFVDNKEVALWPQRVQLAGPMANLILRKTSLGDKLYIYIVKFPFEQLTFLKSPQRGR